MALLVWDKDSLELGLLVCEGEGFLCGEDAEGGCPGVCLHGSGGNGGDVEAI